MRNDKDRRETLSNVERFVTAVCSRVSHPDTEMSEINLPDNRGQAVDDTEKLEMKVRGLQT